MSEAAVTLSDDEHTRKGDIQLLAALAGVALVLHFLFNRRYGFHGDELYFYACADHLAWGYVDHPPLVPFIAWLSRALLGESLFALRLYPALAHAGLIFLTGWLAREMGGGRWAQGIAALTVLISPLYLYCGNVLTTGFEPFWTVCAFILVLMLDGRTPKLWLLFGAAAGLGLLNKHSMLFWGFGLALGLLLTARPLLKSKWMWIGGALTGLIFLPNFIWEQQHHWVTLTALDQMRQFNREPFSAVAFWMTNVVINHPLTVPIWLAGLWFFLFDRRGRSYKTLGIAFVVVVVLLAVMNGKAYYLGGAYPAALAGGAVMAGIWAERWHWTWQKAAVTAVLALGGAAWMPLYLPILPLPEFARFHRLMDFYEPRMEKSDVGQEIPTVFGNMLGHEELAKAVARVYFSIQESERRNTAIYGNTYAQAAAIDYYGPGLGLPKAISGHQTYGLWGPRDYTGETMILIGISKQGAQNGFASVEVGAEVKVPYAPPWLNGQILLCRHPIMSLQQAWPRLVRFH
jgi:hypothetical protein